jgi:hypothetical protein
VTGEVSPFGGSAESQPELRASHADRDRVVEQLRIAAGDGRLTAEELDERLEVALTARTYRELTALVADLPASAGQAGWPAQPKEVMRISRRGGSARQLGKWVVPRRMEIDVAGGNVRLDFTEAVISVPTLRIDLNLRGGNLVLLTRPGVVVDATEVALIGGNVRIRTASGPQPPVELAIEVHGQVKGGNVRAQAPRQRRTFWQWLLRRPAGPAGRH